VTRPAFFMASDKRAGGRFESARAKGASRVSESLRNTWPIVLVKDIRDQLLDKIPFSLILHLVFIISLSYSLPRCERHRPRGYTPIGSWKGLDLQEGNPTSSRAEGPPPNSMGQKSQDLERRCTLGIPPFQPSLVLPLASLTIKWILRS